MTILCSNNRRIGACLTLISAFEQSVAFIVNTNHARSLTVVHYSDKYPSYVEQGAPPQWADNGYDYENMNEQDSNMDMNNMDNMNMNNMDNMNMNNMNMNNMDMNNMDMNNMDMNNMDMNNMAMNTMNSNTMVSNNLMTGLSRYKVASLARLAVAFQPPGQGVRLSDIQQVQVRGVDGQHLEIEAIVCEEESCLTLTVPVPFPNPCLDTSSSYGMDSENDMELCVVDNIDELDIHAQTLIEQMEWNQSNEEEMLGQWQDLESLEKSMKMPDWWEPPGTSAMLDDCNNVLRLLNGEEHTEEMIALATRALSHSNDNSQNMNGDTSGGYIDQLQLEHAEAIAVCPTGVLLRANTKTVAETSNDEDQGEFQTIDVSHQFEGGPAQETESLKMAIVGAVGSAVQYVKRNGMKFPYLQQ